MFRKKSLRFMSLFTACIMLSSIIASAAGAAVATLVSPKSKNLSGKMVEVTVNYDSQSANIKIDTVVLRIDGRMFEKKRLEVPAQKGTISFDWNTQNFTRGQHTIEVQLFSNNKIVTSVSGSGIVSDQLFDNTPPTVKFEGIKNGDVISGKKIINISAKDDSGEPPIVSLLIDNKLKLMQNNPPYAYTLDTTQLEDGDHVVDVYAFDNDGNQSDRVSYKIVVNNGNISTVAKADTNAKVNATSKSDSVSVVAAAPAVKKASEEMTAARVGSEDIKASLETKSSEVTVVAGGSKSNGGVFGSNNKNTTVSAKLEPAKTSEVKAVTSDYAGSNKVKKDLVMASASVSTPVSANIDVPKPALDMASVGVSAVGMDVLAKQESKVTVVAGTGKVSIPDVVASEASKVSAPVVDLNAPKVSGLSNVSVSQDGSVKMAKNIANGDVVLSAPVMDLNIPKASDKKAVSNASAVTDHSMVSAEIAKPVINVEPIKMAKADITSKVPLAGNIGANLIMPESGKAKIRDIVNKNGGVVLWDGKTKTVTTYINNIKVEMRIGSKTIKVNGQPMVVNVIPRIENGRTVIDVTDLKNALAMVKED